MKTEVKERTSQKEASVLGPGTPAPDFKLRSTPDQFVSLSDFRGRPRVVAELRDRGGRIAGLDG